jgi:hypothetical protein
VEIYWDIVYNIDIAGADVNLEGLPVLLIPIFAIVSAKNLGFVANIILRHGRYRATDTDSWVGMWQTIILRSRLGLVSRDRAANAHTRVWV